MFMNNCLESGTVKYAHEEKWSRKLLKFNGLSIGEGKGALAIILTSHTAIVSSKLGQSRGKIKRVTEEIQ